MAVGFEIVGHSKGKSASVVEGGSPNRFRPNGLVAYSTPYEISNYEAITATDDDGMTNMAIDGTAYVATTENIHNGIDNAYWTASATVGTWTFNSATQAHTGTNSINGTATVNGSIARFDAAAPINPNNYSGFRAWLYITSAGTGGGVKALNAQFYTPSNVAIGGTVNLYDYININLLNQWQEVIIPLDDFGNLGTTIDRMDLTVVNTSGQPVDFFLDDVLIQSTGGRAFRIYPVGGDLTEITALELLLVAPSSITRDNHINPLGFGLLSALSNGLDFSREQTGYPRATYNIKNNITLFGFPGGSMDFLVSDGTTAMMKLTLRYPTPIELNNLNNDFLELRVNDDLTGYTAISFSAVASRIRKPDLTSF